MISSQVVPRKAFILSARLMVIQATPLRTSYRMSSKFMVYSYGVFGDEFLRSAVHRETARDAEHLAGDESGVVAGEEQDRAGQVVRLADAA